MDTNTLTVKKLLHYTFGFVPIIAGIDKFTNVLTDWTHYVSPNMADMIPFEVSTFMIIVGVIEIIAGILVIIRPMIGAYIVMAWLILIALTLIVSGSYLDVAVRDLVMAIAAFCLAKLSTPTLNKPKN
ncbi:hypothetical protein M8845_01120 [Gelidibacter japonicus]|jgi:uncharacterized membrane protein HdeD (DUF308 family)|uniref:hypothetical protein n=1 Tax=Gelidibacter japonicus TaxID=1962232 RepID=UPI00202075F5|nr:hypothetical protein [Gelidibacter japonicus]MCL8006016.1 hypothetical protein [Gelidibacter japonicus]